MLSEQKVGKADENNNNNKTENMFLWVFEKWQKRAFYVSIFYLKSDYKEMPMHFKVDFV